MRYHKIFILCLIVFVLSAENLFGQYQIPWAKIAPVIDGQMDPAWDYAARDSVLNIFTDETPPSGKEDFSVEFRMLWDDNFLYLLFIVADDIINTSQSDFWENDVLQIYIDGGNDKTDAYDLNDLQFYYIFDSDEFGISPTTNLSAADFSNCEFASSIVEGGYIYEVALSISDLSNHLALNVNVGNQFGMDIAIGDNDSGERDHLLIWNSPGTDPNYWDKPILWATAQFSDLVAEMETILIPKTPVAITIDGNQDPVWQYAARTTIRRGNKPFISDEDFASEVRFLWDDNNLYIYAIVNDDIVNTSNSAYWMNDVFQFFIDANFERNHEYDQEDLQFSYVVNSEGLSNVWNPYYDGIHSTADFPNCQFASSETEYGYDYEIRLSGVDLSSQLNFNISSGKIFGLELEFADNDTGERESTITWTSPLGSSYWLQPDTWGKAQLSDVIAAVKQIMVPKTSIAPTIDGDMEDAWLSASPEPINQVFDVDRIPDSPDDFSGEYRLLWDNDNLYLFISVIDDILNISNPDLWLNDAMQFYFDGNNGKTPEYEPDDLQFSVLATQNGLKGVYNITNPANFDISDFAQCQFASKQTSNGYNYEILLSGSDMSNKLGLDLTMNYSFGWNITLYDNDEGVANQGFDWNCPYGSQIWATPSLWGTASLTEIPASLLAVTNPASDISYTTAVINGTVNSDGLTMNVSFDYGESTTYGNSISATPSSVSNTENNPVSAELVDLYVGATYHYRVVLSNDEYTLYGADNTFTTLPYPTQLNLTYTVDFTTKSRGSDYKPDEYRLVGLPGGNDEMIANIFSGKQGEDWQVFWDNGEDSDYMIEYNGDNIFRQIPGRAFWMLNKGPLNINQQNKQAAGLNNDGEVEVSIHPGWNLITNPFNEPISWIKIKAVNSIVANRPLYAFNENWDDTNLIMMPFAGYYFDNQNPDRTILRIPFDPVTVSIPKLTEESEYNWKVNIAAKTDQFTDDIAYFAVHENASRTKDEFEYRRPRAVGDILSVYFDRPDWEAPAGTFNCDIRPPVKDIEEWPFKVLIPDMNSANISFIGIEDIPEEFSVYLVNDSKRIYYDLRNDPSIQYTPETKLTNFTVIVGKETLVQNRLEESIPREFDLGRNFPNPFNPSTTIPFALPTDAHVTIKIYNILGEEVCTLLSKDLETGRHYTSWNGKDRNGNSVTSGVYIYQMATNSGKQLSGKMMLLK